MENRIKRMSIERPTIELKKSKEEYFKKFCRAWNQSQKNPCVHCNSYGWIYDPYDPVDVVEGNKLRSRIDCPKCSGTGVGNEEENNKIYEDYSTEYSKRFRKFSDAMTTFNSIKSKIFSIMTEEELRMFKTEWGPDEL